jgi:hypothetical protein
MKQKQWKIWNSESCPNCGDAIEVLSECDENNDTEFEQWFMDGEDCKCVADCGFLSAVSADENGAWMQDGNIDELEDND